MLSVFKASLALAFFNLSATTAYAESRQAGDYFAQKHWVTIDCGAATITRIRKEWSSTGGVISEVENQAGSEISGVSPEQNGYFEYEVNYMPENGQRTSTALNFLTVANTVGTVTSLFTIHWQSADCGNQVATSTVITEIFP